MNTNSTSRFLPGLIAVMTLGVLGMLIMQSTTAREPYTKEELADQEKALLAAVDHGRDLWHGSNPSMSKYGLGLAVTIIWMPRPPILKPSRSIRRILGASSRCAT